MDFLNAHAGLIYGALVVVMFALAFFARRDSLIKLAFLLLVDWAVWNVTIQLEGFAAAPGLLSVLDAMFCGLTVMLWRETRDPAARTVALFFVPASIGWVGFLWAGQGASYSAYLFANLVFLAQLVTVGGAGARQAYRRHVSMRGVVQRGGSAHAHRLDAVERALPEE